MNALQHALGMDTFEKIDWSNPAEALNLLHINDAIRLLNEVEPKTTQTFLVKSRCNISCDMPRSFESLGCTP